MELQVCVVFHYSHWNKELLLTNDLHFQGTLNLQFAKIETEVLFK